MTLLKWLPIRLVDKFLLLMSNFTLGNTEKLGLRRPKIGPIELKSATGKTPILDVGAFSHIKSGKIKVKEYPGAKICKSMMVCTIQDILDLCFIYLSIFDLSR